MIQTPAMLLDGLFDVPGIAGRVSRQRQRTLPEACLGCLENLKKKIVGPAREGKEEKGTLYRQWLVGYGYQDLSGWLCTLQGPTN